MPSTSSSSRSDTPTGGQHDMYYQAESGMEHDPEASRSTMFSPSVPEDGDLDPSRTLIHRQELDSQERLDLEEEAMERELAGPEAYNPTAGPRMGPAAGLPGQPPAASGPANVQPQPEQRESAFWFCVLPIPLVTSATLSCPLVSCFGRWSTLGFRDRSHPKPCAFPHSAGSKAFVTRLLSTRFPQPYGLRRSHQ